MGGLDKGDIVAVYEMKNGGSTGLTASWLKIWFGGKFRWIAGWYTRRV